MPLKRKRSARTEANYSSVFNKFIALAGVREAYTESDIARVVGLLERAHKPSYVAYILNVSRALLGKDKWPTGVEYGFSQRSVEKVKASVAQIRALIEWTKQAGTLLDRAYVAFSTIYGLRCIELARIEQGDVDLVNSTIFVRTAKGGIETEHFLPYCISSRLEGLSISPMSRERMIGTFKRIWALAGLPPTHNMGWHAIRRRLVTELDGTDTNPLDRRRFFRWAMPDIMEQYVDKGPEVDKCILAHHPFLPYWYVEV